MEKKLATLFAICIIVCGYTANAQKTRESYQVTVYHFSNADQENTIDVYLKNAFLPALHKRGIKNIGVFKPLSNDTATDKRIYMIIPLKSVQEVSTLASRLLEDQQYLQNGKSYLDLAYNNPPYLRMENIILQAFQLAPKMKLPKLTSTKASRIYELRSYEGPTEKLYRNKVEMFNQGGEVSLFERLNFNAVFYAEVIAGCRMPNLMYMTSFENQADRDTHWKTFGQDPEWKRLSSLPQYQKNVSRSDIILMHATDYSDY
jgi:hypothetical protein